MTAKPTVADLGIEVAAQPWRRSGDGPGAIEIAFVTEGGQGSSSGDTQWVLMRVAGDPAERVLVYNRHEWECFLDGVKKGEFDDASGLQWVTDSRRRLEVLTPSPPYF